MKPRLKKRPHPSQREKKDVPPSGFFFSRPMTGICAVILITLFAFLPVLKSGFLWDDDAITENALLRTPDGLFKIWTSPTLLDKEAHYWPLVYSVFWAEYQLWGLDPLGYHLANLAFHILNAVLLYMIVSKFYKKIALFSALLFAVHPVHVESAAWIIDLKDLVSTTLYLASFLLFVQFHEREKKIFYVLSMTSLVLALLSKSMAASLPVALFLFLWWKEGRIRRRDIYALLPFFLVALGMALGDARFAQSREQARFGFSFLERGLMASRSTIFYLGKLLFPFSLATFYPRWEVNALQPLQYLYPLALIGILYGFVHIRKTSRAPLALFLFFLAALFPTLGFIDFYFMTYSFVADRFQYLASIGLVLLFTAAFQALFQYQKTTRPLLQYGSQTLIVLVLSILTYRQSTYYQTNETLFRHNIDTYPSAWPAYNILGLECQRKGAIEEAKALYTKAVDYNPRFVDALNNLGILTAQDGNTTKGLVLFQRALEVKPHNPQTHMNLGLAYSMRKDYDKALYHFGEALKWDPGSVNAHYNLGIVLLEKGDPEKGIASLQNALALDPSHPGTHLKMGEGYYRLGNMEESIRSYETALRIIPDWPLALNGLATLYSSSKSPGYKNLDKAITLAESACRMTHYQNPRFLVTLAEAYGEKGRFEDSLKTLRSALKLVESGRNDTLSLEITQKIKSFEIKAKR